MIGTLHEVFTNAFTGLSNLASWLFNEQTFSFGLLSFSFTPIVWILGTGIIVYVGYAITKWLLDIVF